MNHQFLRFLIAGGVNTVVTYAIYFALIHFINPYWSYIAAFISGIFISYFLNLKFTFRSGHSAGKLISYPFVYAVQLLLGISALHLSLKMGVSEEIAPFFAIAVSVPVTFVMSRRILQDGNKQSVNPVLFLSIAAFAVSIAAAYGALFAGDLFPHGILFNSDLSTVYVMWKDMFLEGGTLSEWGLSRVSAPYILTDLPVMWGIYSIIGEKFAAGIYLFGIFTLVLSATGWMIVSDFLFGKSAARRSLVFILSALACVFLSHGSADLFGIVFFPVSHFSTWVFIPFCLLIFLSAASSESLWGNAVYSVILAAACSALTYSDPIFSVWFAAPVFAAGVLCLFLSRRKNLLAPMIALPVGFICARFYGNFFVESGAVAVNIGGFGEPEYITAALRDLLTWTSEAALRHPLLAALWIVYFIILFRTVFRAIYGGGKIEPQVLFVLLFFIFSSVAAVAASVLTGNFTINALPESAAGTGRYILPFYFIPFFIGWVFLPRTRKILLKRFSLVSVSVFLIVISVPNVFKIKENASAFAQYYPPLAECFDTNAHKFNLKKGIASYWYAKSIMATSKTGVSIGQVSVYPVQGGGVGLYKFSFGISDRFYRGPFDFVITNKTRLRPDQDPCTGGEPSKCGHLQPQKRNPAATYILRPEYVISAFKRQPSATFSCGGAEVLVFNPPL